MLNLADSLHLKLITVKDNNGDNINIVGSPELKGVRGTDKRKYLIDLMRNNPRDLNYPDRILHSTCVIRDELINLYTRYLSSYYTSDLES